MAAHKKRPESANGMTKMPFFTFNPLPWPAYRRAAVIILHWRKVPLPFVTEIW